VHRLQAHQERLPKSQFSVSPFQASKFSGSTGGEGA
jgi:hypothetical protein